MNSQTCFLQVGAFKVPLRMMGEGPPVLCSELPLNPFALLGPLQQKLADSFRVILIDLRPIVGHSDTEPPAADLLDYLSDFSLRIMDSLGICKFSMIGSFMFGGVAMETARKEPSRVSKLALLGTLGILPLPTPPLMWAIASFYRLPAIPFLFRSPAFRALVEWTDHYLIGPIRMRQMFYKPETVPLKIEDLYEQYNTPRNAAAALALMWAIRGMSYTKLVQRLHEVSCPSLVIHGEDDKWIPPRYAQELHSRLANSSLTLIPETGHAPAIEDLESAHKVILRFLDGHRETLSNPWEDAASGRAVEPDHANKPPPQHSSRSD